MSKSMIRDVVGFTVFVNDFCKFFVITSQEAFVMYLKEGKENRVHNSIDHNGALLLVRPDQFVMGKYENPSYLLELPGKGYYPINT